MVLTATALRADPSFATTLRLQRMMGKAHSPTAKAVVLCLRPHRFDLMTFRDHNTVTVKDDFGHKKILQATERYYIPPEITWLLKSAGFKKIDIYGAKLGAYSRNDALTIHDFEMLVIADK